MFPFKLGIKTERKQALLEFQKQAGLRFKDLRLLNLAFHHRSYSNEHNNFHANNERMEFLGDSVLGLVTASYLYETFSEKTEGMLAKIKATVVSEETLSHIAAQLHISKFLVLGRGEEISGGREKRAILADTVEAVIGAYYLDSGYKAAQKFVIHLLSDTMKDIAQKKIIGDYKSVLQEFAQKNFKDNPRYEFIRKNGPDHNVTFWFAVIINGHSYGPLSGKSKKEAEQAVAKLAYEKLSMKNSLTLN